ncbi:ATP-binding protein [Ramlibacter rhizophilus]|nr:ATP-binding protein [Ramlibacter rhizophilus]
MKSLRRKLDRILAGSTLLALAVAGLALLAFAHERELRSLRQSVHTEADMVALASAPALSFGDRRDAQASLAALQADPRVTVAALYDDKDQLFATFAPRGAQVPAVAADQDGMEVDARQVVLWRAVMADRERVGTLYLQVQHGLVGSALEFLLALALVMAASLAAALLLSRRLHLQAMAPLRSVTAVARDILRGHPRRLPRTDAGDDEAQALADGFNAMLDDLEQRAQKLQAANAALRASEARYQLVMRGTSAGLWDWDLRAGTAFYAPRFKGLLGYADDELKNAPTLVDDLLHPDDRPALRQALREHLSSGLPFQSECRLRHRDGQWRWFLVTGMSERDENGRAFRMAGSIVDVSARKQAEQVLQDANRAKDEFLATLAHELRNPLAPIRSGLDILKKDRDNGPASQRARDTMERQLMHLIRLVDDLLDISRITNGKIRLDMTRLQLSRVIETAVELSRPAIAARGHALLVDVPPQDIELTGDATRLAQALGNLLNNAAKYTPAAGRIELSVRQEGLEAVVAVRDTGVGIPPEMLESVFSLFTQVDRQMERAQGGLGIGLYLVRSLVELHQGTVTASSAGPGQGSTFTVRLPCLAAPSAAEDVPVRVDAGWKAGASRVLVVDDNVDAAETLVTVLDMLGHEARSAHAGEEALALAASFQPELVLLDIGLPGMDGYEVARRLRADARLGRVLLVALTGWGSQEDRKRARDAGFDHHLTKPVDVAAVEALLAQLPARPGLAPAQD